MASDALNRLALVADDIGPPAGATELCWLHANVYRQVSRSLAPVEGRT
ncbi:hypothetical protein [Actinoplanes couchii]|uniref:Transposase n=1 Tax=Actinoplanes couchii TaxID=403638 RepID=A0ABQ3XR32_9ACTN|nr:hypothetical protein [Actinoplanes couchii]MDR6318183.1 hypothetical protein [Actinoplanes couchii]GID60977.1 hypothetical protein Aco03nite_093810 [Actinoplanes couchii]